MHKGGGVISPRKLRLKLIGTQRGRKPAELDTVLSSSTGGPEKLGLAEYAKDSLLAAGSGNADDEGVSSVQEFNDSEENGHAVLHDEGHSLQTAGPVKLSITAPASEEVLDLGSVVRNSAALKDFRSKENHLVQLKVQNFTKPTSTQVEYAGNLNLVHPVRTFEDDSFDYDSGHDNVSASSFEFHKGDRAFNRLVLGPLSKPAPSKWDDAEKWLVNLSSGDNHVKNKLKAGSVQSQGAAANSSRKISFPGQAARQPGTANSHIAKTASSNASGMLSVTETAVVDGRNLNKDEGETKKIDPNKPIPKLDAGGPSKFAFMPEVAHPMTRSSNDSLDRYSLEDVFCCDLGDPKEVNDSEAVLKPSLRIEKPIADPAIDLSKHGASFPHHSATSVRSVSMRDMGTEMTPITSQEPSRTGTPVRATTPTMRSPVSSQPSTPGRAAPASSPMDVTDNELDCQAEVNTTELSEKELHMKTRREIMALGAQLGKANIAAWASKEEEDEDASKSLKTRDLEQATMSVLETRAAAWEEAEKAKYMARYKREEVKIQAWENHQKAKAEAEMRRIEVLVDVPECDTCSIWLDKANWYAITPEEMYEGGEEGRETENDGGKRLLTVYQHLAWTAPDQTQSRMALNIGAVDAPPGKAANAFDHFCVAVLAFCKLGPAGASFFSLPIVHRGAQGGDARWCRVAPSRALLTKLNWGREAPIHVYGMAGCGGHVMAPSRAPSRSFGNGVAGPHHSFVMGVGCGGLAMMPRGIIVGDKPPPAPPSFSHGGLYLLRGERPRDLAIWRDLGSPLLAGGKGPPLFPSSWGPSGGGLAMVPRGAIAG
eukprot:Gb_26160 [translate_table: standard]